MSATTETASPAVEVPSVETPEVPQIYSWTDIATLISCLALDMMDLKEKLDTEADEAKKAEMQKDLDQMETKYGELFLIYEKTPRDDEDGYEDSSYGWECDYENGQGCADW